MLALYLLCKVPMLIERQSTGTGEVGRRTMGFWRAGGRRIMCIVPWAGESGAGAGAGDADVRGRTMGVRRDGGQRIRCIVSRLNGGGAGAGAGEVRMRRGTMGFQKAAGRRISCGSGGALVRTMGVSWVGENRRGGWRAGGWRHGCTRRWMTCRNAGDNGRD